MNKIMQESRMKEALDLILEGEADLSNALSQGGLTKQLTKAVFNVIDKIVETSKVV